MSTSNKVISKPKKPVVTDWHRAEIICALRVKGTTLQRLSRQNNYHTNSLNMTLGRPWPKGERIIADAIGIDATQIWPSRYNADGTPKSGRGERGLGRHKPKHTPAAAGVNDQLKQAA